jgi:hypothetical protein
MGDHGSEERVREGGEVRRVGKGEDVLDIAIGKSVTPLQTAMKQSLTKPFEKMGPARDLIAEAPPQSIRPGLTRKSVANPEAADRALASSLEASSWSKVGAIIRLSS